MSNDTYVDLFAGTGVRTVELKLLEETHQRVMELAQANGWPEEEALLTVLAHGLATLQGERQQVEGSDDVEGLRRGLMSLDGMYSVMKFRAFTLTQENQRMAMAISAYQQEHPALMRLVERLRRELEDSKQVCRLVEVNQAPLETPALSSESEIHGACGKVRALLSALLSTR